MPFHFFTDYDLLQQQDPSGAFNPISTLTSRHESISSTVAHPDPGHASMTVHPSAYAICSGRVYVVGTDRFGSGTIDDQTVNLILQPNEQPTNGLPKIKFFIYRGILVRSLFDSQGNIIADTDSFANDLTRKVNLATIGFPGNTQIVGNNSALNLNTPVTNVDYRAPIDNVFFVNNGLYQLFEVHGGECIGKFPDMNGGGATPYGIDIIFDTVGYNPQFFITMDAALIDPQLGNGLFKDHYQVPGAYIPIGASQAEANVRQAMQDQIKLNFLDPAAFYGSFAKDEGINVRKFDDGFDPTSGVPLFINMKGDTLYDNVISKFYNKNTVYIDIRNPENDALNYAGNYSNNIKLKLLNPSNANYTNLSTIGYYRGGFPLFYLNQTDFAAGSNSEVTAEIALPDGQDQVFNHNNQQYNFTNNPTPGLYVPFESTIPSVRSVLANGTSNFVSPFIRNANGGYSTSVKLGFLTYNQQNNQPIANYIRLNYLKEWDMPITPESSCTATVPFEEIAPPSGRTLLTSGYLDNVFRPFSLFIPQSIIPTENTDPNPNELVTNVYYDTVYVNNTQFAAGAAFMANIGIANDINGDITLFAFAADQRAPAKRLIDSGFASFFPGESGGVETFLQKIARLYRSIDLYSPLFLAGDVGTVNNQFPQELIQRNSVGAATRADIGNPNTNALVWITINRNSWLDLVQINKSTDSAPTDINTLPDPYNPGQPFKANFINPNKTFLGVKLVRSGSAPDQTDNISKPYAVYEFYLRGEVAVTDQNGQRVEYKSIRTGITFFSARPSTPTRREDLARFPNFGYSVDTANGENRIISTIYLIPDANITEAEFFEYKEYFQCNIRHTWNNNPLRNNGIRNVGLPSNLLIDADQVTVIRGAGEKFNALNANEIAFKLRKKTKENPTGRSFAWGDRRHGEMFYDKLANYPPNTGPATTRYAEATQNVPSHEFGHCLGTKDRYTYVAKINDINQVIKEYNPGSITFYIQDLDTGNPLTTAFDLDYIATYNWIHNLYSTQNVVRLRADLSNEGIVGPEAEYQDLQTVENPDNQENVVGNADVPVRLKKLILRVTHKQFDIVLDRVNNEFDVAAADPSLNVKKLFSQSRYIFFKLNRPGSPGDSLLSNNPTSDYKGTFIGFRFNEPGNSPVIITDDGFVGSTGVANPNDAIMEQRIASSNFVAYFSPYYAYDLTTGVFDENKVCDEEKLIAEDRELQDVRYGGLNMLKDMLDQVDTGAITIADVTAIFPNYDSSTRTFNISGVNDHYHEFGDGNTRGREIWNKSFGTIPIRYPDATRRYRILYTDFSNREFIINRIKGTV